MPRDAIRDAARRLHVWAFPLVFAQRVRLNLTDPAQPDRSRPPSSAGAPLGAMGHQATVATPELSVGVAPNVDTLYSIAWIDLDRGPVELRMPDCGDRYYSVQIALPDTSSPWALGRRTHGPRLPVVELARGPQCKDETLERIRLRTPHRHVMVCVRILVDAHDPDDVAVVRALQSAIDLRPTLDSFVPWVPSADDLDLAALDRTDETSSWPTFRHALGQVLRDLDPSAVPPWARNALAECDAAATAGRMVACDEGLAAAMRDIDAAIRVMGSIENGWAANWRGPDFGDDHLLRAAVAASQIYVNPAEEAVYPVCEVDADGEVLDGRRGPYRVTFAAGEPPVAFFWSLTVYHARGLLAANPIDRHAIGDRTPGLRWGVRGSLGVVLDVDPPDDASVNWLPVPAGPFRLMLRLYGPTRKGWVPPVVERFGDTPPRPA